MGNLGSHLKACRNEMKLSLKSVYAKTGITNSRLSKIEQGSLKCHPEDLRQLAKTYNVSVISLFLEAGFLTLEDLEDYKNMSVFQGVSDLDSDELKHVQNEIDFLNRKKVPVL